MNGTETTAEPSSVPWAIFPCHWIRDGKCSCGKADCGSPGKHPLTANGVLDASNDEARQAKWWKVNPQANVGVATGEANGIVVVDIDPQHGGSESLLEIEESYGHLPETWEVETGGGGTHLYYRYPTGGKIHSRNGWRPGVDIKADGGYVIAPPSNHVSGGEYCWAEGCRPGQVALADIPPWLLELLPRKDEPQPDASTNGKPKPASGNVFTFTAGGASLLDRAQAYADKAEPASEGNRNDAAFRLAGHIAAISDNGERLSEPDIFEVVSSWNRRNSPPLHDAELWRCVKSALVNGTAREAKENTADTASPSPHTPAKPCQKFLFCDLAEQFPTLNRPVVHGLFREGETVNVVSTSKAGKSWLAYSLGLSIIANRPWLQNYDVEPGRVLLVDNELHCCTLANRIPAVAEKLGIHRSEYVNELEVWPLRGNLRTIVQLGEDFASLEPGKFKLIILDAKYRLGVPGKSENDNAAETQIYNLIDQYAAHTKAAFVLVHHTSKGNQAEKRVTDVGAGAGAQSRAADCHLVLREHEQDDVAVLDAAVRSFAPVEPLAVRWEFPLWLPAGDIDTSKLKGRLNRGEQHQHDKDREGCEDVLKALRRCGPLTRSKLITEAGMGKDRLQRLLGKLLQNKDIISHKVCERGNNCDEYSLPE